MLMMACGKSGKIFSNLSNVADFLSCVSNHLKDKLPFDMPIIKISSQNIEKKEKESANEFGSN